MIISLSQRVWRRAACAASPFVSCSSVRLLPDVGSVACDRRSLVVLSPLLVHTRSHTCTAKVEAFTCGYAHTHTCVHVHSHFHPHMDTRAHFLPPPSTCRCAPLRPRHALHSSLLAGPCVPVTTAVTWSMSAFKLKLTSSSDTPLKSQS